MKTIQELVAYFDRRGKLSRAEVRKLLERGHLASDAPQNMLELAQPVGSTYYFRVTGASEGSLWGTDIYTGDSTIAMAAVHAGLVKTGEAAVIRVTSVAPPPDFNGCPRHGVQSHDFGRFGSAYTLAGV